MRYVLPFLLLAKPVLAAPPDVVGADALRRSDGVRVSVTLSHPDTGWDHYADGWRIESEDGTVLGMRELVHPHVNEQPFTRSLSGVQIPEGTRRVYIRARCLVDGWNEDRVPLDLP